MTLTVAEVAAWLGCAPPQESAASVVVTGMSLSSQRITPGDLYAAVPGARVHGADFAPDAVARGAVAVLADQPLDVGVPVLVVPDVRAVLGATAAEIFGHPACRLTTLAVTGTQGKTTTTRLAEAGLSRAGVRAGVIGTIGTRMAGFDVHTALTTPEASDLQRLLASMVDADIAVCAMEVSSHALVLGRVDGLVFDVAAFTNLGRDHLDFHSDVEDYFAAKARLFTPEHARRAVISIDDEYGRRLTQLASIPVVTMSINGPADWQAVDIETSVAGSRFTAIGPSGDRIAAGVDLPGRFNVANALTAIACAGEAGLDAAAVAQGIAVGGGVPGRLEPVTAPDSDVAVFVDYAHKPDAVTAALETLRPVTAGRLIIVIGAGGDRDAGKRPLMGAIAAQLADRVIVTDDNPRTEDPAAIRAAVIAGATGGAEVIEIADRGEAIRMAVAEARPGDVVLVAGKGHETGQEVQGVVTPFDDRVVAREAVAAR